MTTTKREDELWIKTELIPSLVADGKLDKGPNAVLRSIQATRISMDETYMMTACYRVTIELAESANEKAETSLIKLVVKVN